MKRLFATAFALMLVCAMCIIPASAAESYDLIPTDSTWTTTPYEGFDITVDITEDAAVFSADGYWPSAETYYADDARITVDIDEYSLVYDFTVETGMTNINFYLTDGFGTSVTHSISNNTLGAVSYDSGSGDLNAGEYKGVVKLSDFANSTMFLNNQAFPQNIIVDNQLTFTGIQVYSVNSATITIREIAIVPNDVAGDPTGGATGSDDPADESSEEPAESGDESAESSETKTESSVAANNSTESNDTDNATGDEEEGLSTGALIAIIAAVVVVIAVVIIVVSKKKKQ